MISPSVGGPGLSVVVNAAGIIRDKSLLKMTEEAYDEVLKVNLKVCTLFSVSPMINKKGGGGGGGGGLSTLKLSMPWHRHCYITIFCCVNTVKRGVLRPPSPLGENTALHEKLYTP